MKAIEKAHQENSDVIVAECFTPERIKTSSWVYYSDLSVLGEKYSEMKYIDTPKDFAEQKIANISGKTSPSPPDGWLTLACFQVQWSKKCKALMKQVQDIMSAWPWIQF